MNTWRLELTYLYTGLAIVVVAVMLGFVVPMWAGHLMDEGYKADDLSGATKFLIDSSNILKYYGIFFIPLSVALIIAGLALVLRRKPT